MDDLAKRVIEDEALDPQRVNAAVNAIDKAARLQMPKKVELNHSGSIKHTLTEMTDEELAAIAAGKAV
jgi:hypothetical protein